MKQKKFFIGLLMCSAMGLTTSCLSETKDLEPKTVPEEAKTGSFVLDLNTNADFTFQTRAVVDESVYRNTDNYNVIITNSSNVVKFNGTFAALKNQLPMELDLGSYTVQAQYGAEAPASRETFLSKGSGTFTIQAANQNDNPVAANIACTPTAGKVLVQFDSSMDTYCDIYDVDFSGTAALGSNSAHWAKGETAPYYLTLAEAGETVTYTIHFTVKDEYATMVNGNKATNGTASGTFQLERNKAKKLVVGTNYTPTTDGGLTITIEIDDSTNDKSIDIEVPVTWI